jgi:DNA polymerase I-like protein with 3'-5' exonuclease and polymerase domains
MMDEIIAEKDLHTDNQTRLGLPSRGIAKIFVFRLIYGGSAYSYAMDPDFAECRMNEKQWQKVIDAYYEKYPDLKRWHTKIVQDVTLTGKLVMPTGREYHFQPQMRRGTMEWPRTTILNYPVQGLGADLMALARVALRTRLQARKWPNVLLVNTIHDSIVIDAPDKYTDLLARLMLDVFEAVPRNFERVFEVPFNLPMKAEIQFGRNLKDTIKWEDKNNA